MSEIICAVGAFAIGFGFATARANHREAHVRDVEYARGSDDTWDRAYLSGWIDRGRQLVVDERSRRVRERADHPSTPFPLDPFVEGAS